jgi:AraC-like DNA-binding protein
MKHHYIEGEWINALMRAFAHLGLDTQKIIADVNGFENERLIASYRLEISSARKMWYRADKLAQDPLLGFKIGSLQDYRAIGVLAPVIWHSPDVYSALKNIVMFQSLISESGAYKIDEIKTAKESFICFEYIAAPNSVPVNVHQILSVITGTIGIVRAISDNSVRVARLYLPPSLNAGLLSDALSCNVIGRAGNLAICFSTEQLGTALLGRDNSLYQINKAYAEKLLKAKNRSIALIDSMKNVIENYGFSQASIETAELSMGIHKRSLQRSLLEHGTSFRQLKEEVLKEQAVHLLLNEKIDIASLAVYLGYSEPSAFHRAFKAWFGMTPRKFSKQRHYPL